MTAKNKTALVISAHAADFVWRCGGAIALHADKGYDVTVVCLSFGERGESAKLWKQEGMDLQPVKVARRDEAEAAAKALGVHNLVCMDLGDYPLVVNEDDKYALLMSFARYSLNSCSATVSMIRITRTICIRRKLRWRPA